MAVRSSSLLTALLTAVLLSVSGCGGETTDPAAPGSIGGKGDDTGCTWFHTTASLNLRQGPGTTHAVVVTVAPGTRVRWLATSGEWHRVRATGYEDQETWAHGGYLACADPPPATLAPRLLGFDDGRSLSLSPGKPATLFLLARAQDQLVIAARATGGRASLALHGPLGESLAVLLASDVDPGPALAASEEIAEGTLSVTAPAEGVYALRLHATAPVTLAVSLGCGGAACGPTRGRRAHLVGATAADQPMVQDLDGLIDRLDLPRQVVQVDLASQSKNYQYTADIVSGLGLRYTACGLVASASGYRQGATPNLELIRWLRDAAGKAYGMGIQPTELSFAQRAVFGQGNVHQRSGGNLVDLYLGLLEGRTVVVDMLCGPRGGRELPAATANGNLSKTYAHFARVLGLDSVKRVLFIENSLNPVGEVYWTVPFADFLEVWQHPETLATDRPAIPEDVSQWLVLLDVESRPHAPEALAVTCGGVSWIDTCQSTAKLLRCSDGEARLVDCTCQGQAAGFDDRCADN